MNAAYEYLSNLIHITKSPEMWQMKAIGAAASENLGKINRELATDLCETWFFRKRHFQLFFMILVKMVQISEKQ